MGSVRLKKKTELHYRRGPASGGCSQCNHYVGDYVVKTPRGFCGIELRKEPRCKVLGLLPGRAYRIHRDNICDRYDNSRHMARYGQGIVSRKRAEKPGGTRSVASAGVTHGVGARTYAGDLALRIRRP